MPFLNSIVLDDELMYERVEQFDGGMNGFQRAANLPQNVCQYLENVIVPDSFIVKTRPGADPIGATRPDGATAASTRIQGMAYLDTPALEQLLAVYNALLYKYESGAWAACTMGAYSIPNATLAMAMASGSDGPGAFRVFLSDGTNNWQMWNGAILTDLGSAQGLGSPPVGATMMTWHAGRMFAAGVAASPDQVWASDLQYAGATHWDWAKFSFRVTAGEGEDIRGLASLPGFWLAVLKGSSIWMVNTDPTALDATGAATAGAWPQQRITENIGCVGKRAWCVVGNDVMFLARDGIRSLRRQVAQSDYEVIEPMSEPIQPLIDRINWEHADTVCAKKYNHLVFFSLPLDAATTPSHTVVWNLRTKSWMGVWSGWTPTCWIETRFSDVHRLVFGDASGFVNQWKDYADDGADSTFVDAANMPAPRNIATKIRLRAWNFQDPVSPKDGQWVELRFVSSLAETVTVNIFCDEATALSYTVNSSVPGNQLPVDLPFDLASAKPKLVRKSLVAAGTFNEMYVEIDADQGKVCLKNVTAAGFMNTVESDV